MFSFPINIASLLFFYEWLLWLLHEIIFCDPNSTKAVNPKYQEIFIYQIFYLSKVQSYYLKKNCCSKLRWLHLPHAWLFSLPISQYFLADVSWFFNVGWKVDDRDQIKNAFWDLNTVKGWVNFISQNRPDWLDRGLDFQIHKEDSTY